MSKNPPRLIHVIRTQGVFRNPDGEEGSVYGLTVVWADGTESRADDLGTSSKDVDALVQLLNGSDLEKIHFEDVIDDFLA